LLGAKIAGSEFTFDLYNSHGYGAYICGEETRCSNRWKARRPAALQAAISCQLRLYGKPTPSITPKRSPRAVHHQSRCRRVPRTGRPNNGGTKIFSVSGDVAQPGNFEVPLGTPFAKLLQLAGGMRDGKKIKAVIPAGLRCRCCRATS